MADSLFQVLQQKSLPDSLRIILLNDLSYYESDVNKGLVYADSLINIAKRIKNKKYIRIGYYLKGNKYRLIPQTDKAVEAYFESARLAHELNDLRAEQESFGAIGDTYAMAENFPNAFAYYDRAIGSVKSMQSLSNRDSSNLATFLLNKGDAFLKTKKFDSAYIYVIEAKLLFEKLNNEIGLKYSSGNLGMVYAHRGMNDSAEINLQEAIPILEANEDYYPLSVYLLTLADIEIKRGNTAAAFEHAKKSLRLAEQRGLWQQMAEASMMLSKLYEDTGNEKLALLYYRSSIAYRDSAYNIERLKIMEKQRADYEVSQKQLELDLSEQQKRSQQNLLVALAIILVLTIVMLGIILRNDQHKKKAYKVLNLQKKKTDEQKERAETALAELKEAQKQLIQSAKMASLGELTAGIAHEIQNPLNFVNNFSEISTELLEELKAATDKQEANELANELDSNLKKIALHGKRAESIVKNMLQHSRMRSGQHEPTDINNLIEEFLQLSYSGIRAVDKNFNARFDTQLDPTIEKVDMIPQDIGRVFLNIFQNAFYAVDKRKREENSSYQPHVSVSSRKLTDQDKVEIVISDNGTGIPENVLDKIFQPFFTTKPTGQGTGLGLWLSYDIIKAHNGDISVESSNGEYTRFTITLPIHRLTSKMAG